MLYLAMLDAMRQPPGNRNGAEAMALAPFEMLVALSADGESSGASHRT